MTIANQQEWRTSTMYSQKFEGIGVINWENKTIKALKHGTHITAIHVWVSEQLCYTMQEITIKLCLCLHKL